MTGLPPQRPDQVISPPPTVLAPGGAAGVFRGRLVIISGTSTNGSTGLFAYSPTPAAGNLVASIAAAAGTDPYGNAYLAGIVGYFTSSGTSYAMQVGTSAQLGFYSATTQAGPWTALADSTTELHFAYIVPQQSTDSLLFRVTSRQWPAVPCARVPSRSRCVPCRRWPCPTGCP